MNRILLFLIVLSCSQVQVTAQVPNHQPKATGMNRIERTEKKYQQLFGQPISPSKTDPELMTILQRFIFGDVFYAGTLDDKTRELITITTLTVNQALPQLKAHTNAALKYLRKASPNQGSDLSISSIHWLSQSIECTGHYQ